MTNPENVIYEDGVGKAHLSNSMNSPNKSGDNPTIKSLEKLMRFHSYLKPYLSYLYPHSREISLQPKRSTQKKVSLQTIDEPPRHSSVRPIET